MYTVFRHCMTQYLPSIVTSDTSIFTIWSLSACTNLKPVDITILLSDCTHPGRKHDNSQTDRQIHLQTNDHNSCAPGWGVKYTTTQLSFSLLLLQNDDLYNHRYFRGLFSYLQDKERAAPLFHKSKHQYYAIDGKYVIQVTH